MDTKFSTIQQQVIDFYNLNPEQINYINEMDKVYLVVFNKGLKKRPKFYSKKINIITTDDIIKTIELINVCIDFIDNLAVKNYLEDFLLQEGCPIKNFDDMFTSHPELPFFNYIMDAKNHIKGTGLESKKIVMQNLKEMKNLSKDFKKYLNLSFEEISELSLNSLEELKGKTFDNLEKQILINLKDTTFPIAISAKKKVNQFLGLGKNFDTLDNIAEYILNKPEVLQMEEFYIYLKAGQTYREIYDN
jgi:hypothetical protein